jgi:hypothetical protein
MKRKITSNNHILYKITYLPHLNTNFPKYYIGSKFRYNGGYFGSVSSLQKFEYTNNLSLKDWWELKVREDNLLFMFEVLESFHDISPQELVLKERDLHISLDVLSENYFNQSIATQGFCSVKKTEDMKKKISEKTKEYWDSEEGKEKKLRCKSDENRKRHSEIAKKMWENPSDELLNRVISGRPKGSKNKDTYKKPSRRIKYKDVVYEDAFEASVIHKVTHSRIRERCRINYNNEWFYL